jgi:hypothetical protein
MLVDRINPVSQSRPLIHAFFASQDFLLDLLLVHVCTFVARPLDIRATKKDRHPHSHVFAEGSTAATAEAAVGIRIFLTDVSSAQKLIDSF